jgi:acetylglutamate kinase
MKSSRVLIKLGGAAFQDETVLQTVAEALKQFRQYGYQVILVHGGGPSINAELTRRGIQWRFEQGQRVTTPEMMDVIESVLCGDINSKLVRYLGSHGIPSVGLSGADGRLLLCKAASETLGQVGSIQDVTTNWVEGILKLENSPVPVIAPIGVGEKGEAYNINADWAASHLAVALKAEYLIYLTDQTGILNLQKQLIPRVNEDQLSTLMRSEVVTGGMITKTKALCHALQGGVQAVRVMNSKDSLKGLWSDKIGTWCVPTESNEWEGINYVAV